MSEAKIVIGAVDNASRVLSSVRTSMAQVQQSASALTSTLGLVGGASLGGFALMARSIINGVDAMNDLKDATGASIENISALEDVAARTGTSMDTVGTSLIKFNQALNNAEPDSKISKALDAIGLSAKELKSIDPAEALRRTAVALAGFADDGNKARLTQELFGKSLREVAPFLKDLSEQGQLNAKVTTEQAEAAEKFNKELFALQKNATDAGRAITADLVPAISKLLANYTEIRTKGLLGSVVKDAAFDLIGLGMLTEDASKDINNLIKTRDALLKKGEKNGFTDSLREDISEINELLEVSRIRQAALIDTSAQYGDQISRKSAGRKSVGNIEGKTTKGKDEDADFKRYLEQLDKEIEKSLELTKVQQLLADINTRRLTVSPQQQEELLWRAKLADSMQAEADARKLADKAMEDASKSSSKYLEDLAKEQQAQEKNNEALRQQVEEIGLTKNQLNELTLRRLDAAIATQEQTRAQLDLQNSSEAEIAAMEEKIRLLKEQRALTAKGQIAQVAADAKTEQDKASKEFADTLQNDLKGAFSAAFRDTSGDPLKAFGDAIANVIFSRASSALVDSMLGSVGGSGGGNLLAKLFSFDGGGYTGTGSRAGGLDGKGGFMAMLHPQETVLDHTKGQNGGGTTTVIQNFTVGDVASVSMVQKAIAGSERRIAGSIGRSMQYGGAMS